MLAALLRGSMKLPLQLLGGQLIGIEVIHIGDRIGRACGKTARSGGTWQGTGSRLLAKTNAGNLYYGRQHRPEVSAPNPRLDELIWADSQPTGRIEARVVFLVVGGTAVSRMERYGTQIDGADGGPGVGRTRWGGRGVDGDFVVVIHTSLDRPRKRHWGGRVGRRPCSCVCCRRRRAIRSRG